ncbi:ribulokinase [Bacillus sp. ISL-40]|uniref:ribulokinase n=1 Tax=unclassified Bacillus (in: firmicutes) TaxID=185979 RepID=UPI001BE8AE37|nr:MULTISPECIES: ribulokinase [unclassified Bacillus (in: firmicutes)]MBT2700489.1 ribulokinase [Bacillus sp. ISL-40]MBT2719935.1 ribulokinase [Bacillus sp. ISL-46]MBT2742756.1 ribulokinase [Bacillus sp. ISL-77]
MAKYSIGVDYGTQSGRAVLVEVGTGKEVATAVKPYTHGVMDEFLPNGTTKLEHDWALQHPADYLEVLAITIPEVLKQAQVSKDDVIGLGIDFTACTVLPIDANGTPLCFKEEFSNHPHSYVKLWKHHAAQDEANRLNEIAEARGEQFLQRYGGKISSEWLFPKVWQILNEAPEIYDAANQILEATDWVISELTGAINRNSCTAGYKAIWHKQDGYPSNEFFKALDPRLENVVEDKLSTKIVPIGSKAGEITEKAAKLTGLNPGTAVAVANVDAHVAVPAVGITEPGKLLMIMGTSTCHILLGEEEKIVPGMCGVVEDGVIPGFMGYEAGQSCVGDHFEWLTENCVPASYHEEAKEKGVNIHQLLTDKASQLQVGESGLLALDWWNGNRSTLVDADLTGVLLGATLLTKPEEIYRALIEATAYGTRMIVETFRNNGVPVNEVYAAGGIAEKNAMMMQIYADVLNMDIKISASSQTPALGSAMFGAVAAGKERGGYDHIIDAAKDMGRVKDYIYQPIKDYAGAYDQLFNEYARLYDYFGRGENNVMKTLKKIKKESSLEKKEEETVC